MQENRGLYPCMKKEMDALRNLKIFASFMMAAMLAICVFLTPAMAEGAGEFAFVLNADGTGYVVSAYNGQAASVTVPDWHNNLPVVAIGEGAFQGNAALTAVSLPSTITVIGKAAFKNCSSLKNLTSYVAAAQPPVLTRIPGDANDSGKVDIMDALLTLQYSVGHSVTINLENANCNGDASANIMDALLILQYSVGHEVELI